jgi:hypothetical protein
MPRMHLHSTTLAITLLAQTAIGQTTLFWTGNGDHWGASPHTKWSESFARQGYFQLVAGAAVRMHYDLANMEGDNRVILMNRQDVVV